MAGSLTQPSLHVRRARAEADVDEHDDRQAEERHRHAVRAQLRETVEPFAFEQFKIRSQQHRAIELVRITYLTPKT